MPRRVSELDVTCEEQRLISDDRFREIWIPLEAYFRSVVAALQDEFPAMWPVITCSQTKVFPFIGYTSFLAVRDPDRAEDCVMMMQVVRRRGQLVASFDISSGDGELFASGPGLSIAVDEVDDAQIEFLRAAERAAEEFFTGNIDEIRRAMVAES